MASRVLITRPQPGAAQTAARLAALGYEPVAVPLTEIVSLPVQHDHAAEVFDLATATSANGLRHTPPFMVERILGKPLFVVGDATAEVAKSMGVQNIWSAQGTA